MMDSDYSASDDEFDYSGGEASVAYGLLPFNAGSLESLILNLCDTFNFRVLMEDSRAKTALVMTAGLTLAGCLIGRHYGGNTGMALGGAAGGLCALGVVAVSMRDLWEDVKFRLSELFDIAYDYLRGLNLEDYKAAATFLTSHTDIQSELASILFDIISSKLGKTTVSTLIAA